MNETEEVAQLVLRERQGRDRGWWVEIEQAFWPDSRVTISWYVGDGPGFVARSRAMSERGIVSVHRMSPPVVRVAGDRAWAEASATIEARTTIDGVLADLVSAARLNYRVERRAGRWGILALDVVYERDALTAVVPGSMVAVPAADLAAFRLSCALLAWCLSRQGVTIAVDVLGDDQPDARDEFYRQTWSGFRKDNDAWCCSTTYPSAFRPLWAWSARGRSKRSARMSSVSTRVTGWPAPPRFKDQVFLPERSRASPSP